MLRSRGAIRHASSSRFGSSVAAVSVQLHSCQIFSLELMISATARDLARGTFLMAWKTVEVILDSCCLEVTGQAAFASKASLPVPSNQAFFSMINATTRKKRYI
jgi:hypothetical protein